MKLSSYLDKRLIFTDIEAVTKDEGIKKLVEKIAKQDETFSKLKDSIETAVMKRENEISTVMGQGIGIPHARIEGYDDVVVAIGVLRDSIKCETATKDTDDLKVMFMIIAGQVKNKIMLKIMSAIMKLVAKKDLLELIKTNKDRDNIYENIKKSEIDVSERLTAEDIMNTEIKPAYLSDTLEDIARRFVVENLRGIPVVDDKGKFLGEITQRELIEFGMPKYTSLMNDLGFMTVGEPFEQYFKNEKTVTIKDLYRKKPVTVDRTASIMEVTFLMVTKGNTRIYVVEDQKLYGMILRSDIIKKVLHI